MHMHEIPLVNLEIEIQGSDQHYSKSILVDEIKDIYVEHVAISSKKPMLDVFEGGHKFIYLFLKGTGVVVADNTSYEIVPETILLPNATDSMTIESADNTPLHYLKIRFRLSAQDHLDLQNLPSENTQQVYYAKFSDCQSYSEAIKSPNTVSRTILSNEYIPRVAMGTVKTMGPDEVAAHEHPMLDQLFLGLSNNNCIVYADEKEVDFPQYSVLHIPLGARHSVSVKKDQIMYYVWMDFFLDKKGEQWLNTHKVNANQ